MSSFFSENQTAPAEFSHLELIAFGLRGLVRAAVVVVCIVALAAMVLSLLTNVFDVNVGTAEYVSGFVFGLAALTGLLWFIGWLGSKIPMTAEAMRSAKSVKLADQQGF